MSVDKPGRIFKALQIPETLPDARTDEGRAAIKAGSVKFDQRKNKEALLAILRRVYGRGPKSEPFDADKSWRYLVALAQFYLWEATTKQETVSGATRVKQLNRLVMALGRARAMVDQEMRDDFGCALWSAWWDGPEYTPDGPLIELGEREFKKLVASLATLETAAMRAWRHADDEVATRSGRPKGTAILSWRFIERLASVYRDRTGEKPGAGDGPFAQFVCEFLTGLGRYNDEEGKGKRMSGKITQGGVVDAIKDARAWTLKRPTTWGPSPFGE